MKILAILLVVPYLCLVLVWVYQRIYFLKYPAWVKWRNYLRKHNMLWLLYVEKSMYVTGLILIFWGIGALLDLIIN
jgi:hypothetical protein